MSSCFSGNVFFYCAPAGAPENSNYQHGLVCLAEGFQQLEIPFFSSTNYWLQSPDQDDYLFRHDSSVSANDCDLVLLSGAYLEHYKKLPENLFHVKRRYATAYIDMSDGITTDSWKPEFRQFDFILKAHYNSKCAYPSNVHPWAFGLTNRILESVDPVPFADRDWQIIVNFRVKHLLRDYIKARFLSHLQDTIPLDTSIESFEHQNLEPYDYLLWSQSGRRHYPGYYRRLSKTLGCAAFGGELMPAFPRDIASPIGVLARKILKRKLLKQLHPKFWRISQWDSWRFWESLAAGCVTFHLDFDQQGFRLPEMPQNWQHYVGVDLTNMPGTISKICDNPSLLENISFKGRQWALEHYSPVPTALRLIRLIEKQ